MISATSLKINRLSQNKSFFNDLNRLNAELDRKNAEIEDLKIQLKSTKQAEERQMQETRVAYSSINELQDVKNSLQLKCDKLMDDNYALNSYNKELESKLNMSESDLFRNNKRLEEVEFELKNSLTKLAHREENMGFANRQLAEIQGNLSKVQDAYRNSQMEVDRLRGDIQDLNISKQREIQASRQVEGLLNGAQRQVDEKEKEVHRLVIDVEGLRLKNDKLIEDNTKLFTEVEKLKNHLIVLSEQNSRLAQELDVIGDQDERIREKLSRKEKISQLIMNNKSTLERSMRDFEETRMSPNRRKQ